MLKQYGGRAKVARPRPSLNVFHHQDTKDTKDTKDGNGGRRGVGHDSRSQTSCRSW